MITEPSRVRLARRAWISDGSSGATVAPDGTVDWYQSAAPGGPVLLWRLYDPDGPAVRVGVHRDTPAEIHDHAGARIAYRGRTNVAETVTRTASGRCLSVTDFVEWSPTGGAGPKGLLRIARALAGPVDVEVELVCGRRSRVVQTSGGIRLGDLTVNLGGGLARAHFEGTSYGRNGQRWRAVTTLDSGQDAIVTLGHAASGATAGATADSADAAMRLASTAAAWSGWVDAMRYDGLYVDAVERSLLTLRSLTDRHGAAGGAGTTSLPRRLGSERSADGRWVKLRDVAASVPTYAHFGFDDDAAAAETWLRYTVSQASRPWPAHYDKDGQPAPDLCELAWQGWRGSQPVNFGRRALPADAEALAAVLGAIGASTNRRYDPQADPGPLSAAWEDISRAVDGLADTWQAPDCGRWESSGEAQCYTSQRLAAWATFNRAAGFARSSNPLDMSAATWQAEGTAVAKWLDKQAERNAGQLTIYPPSEEADAALLAVAWQGPWPADHPVVAATVDLTLARLSSGAFVYRHSDKVGDGTPGPDNPDLEATFLAARALAIMGRWEEAHERMEAAVNAIARSGPGVLAETVDPASGATYGNLACGPVALALLDAAAALSGGPG